MEDYQISRKDGPLASFQKQLAASARSKEFTDVTLVCKDLKPVGLHRVVLSAASLWFRLLSKGWSSNHFFLSRDLLPNLPEKPTIYLDNIDPLALAPLVEFIYGGEARVAKNLLPSFMEAANILKVKGLIEEEADPADVKSKPTENPKGKVQDQPEEELCQTNQRLKKSEDNFEAVDNSDDCLMRKFDGLEEDIDAIMKDVKTFEGEKEGDVVNQMETVVEENGKNSKAESGSQIGRASCRERV